MPPRALQNTTCTEEKAGPRFKGGWVPDAGHPPEVLPQGTRSLRESAEEMSGDTRSWSAFVVVVLFLLLFLLSYRFIQNPCKTSEEL